MAYSDKDWSIVKAFYERGLSLSEIVSRPEVVIKAKSQISRKAAKEAWQKGTEKQQLLKKEIELNQAVAEIKEQKATMNATELSVHDALVRERSVIVDELARFAIKAIKKGRQMIDSVETGMEFKALAEGVDRVSITAGINERHAKPAQTNIQTNTQNNYAQLNDDDLVREAKRLKDVNQLISD